MSCPDCGQACERVLSAPIVSVRGAEYRAAQNKENRAANFARAAGEVAKLKEAAAKKYGQVSGHTHNCALNGCFGEKVMAEAKLESPDGETSVAPNTSATQDAASATKEATSARRFGDLPHLVGAGKK